MKSLVLTLVITSTFCLDIRASDAIKIEKTLRQIYEKKGCDEALAALKKLFQKTPNEAILHYLQAELIDPKTAAPEQSQTSSNAKYFHYTRALEILEKSYTNKYKVKNVSELKDKIAAKIKETQPLIKEYEYFTPDVGNPYCIRPIEKPKTEIISIRSILQKCAHEGQVSVDVEYMASLGAYSVSLTGPFTDLLQIKDLPISIMWIHGTKCVDYRFLKELPVTYLSARDMEACDFSQILPRKLSILEIHQVDEIKHFNKIEEIKTLRSLTIQCKGVSQNDLHILRTLKLRSLSLAGVELTDLTFLKEIPLESLFVSSCKITPDAVKSLIGHPTLSRLVLPEEYKNADSSILPKVKKISFETPGSISGSNASEKRRLMRLRDTMMKNNPPPSTDVKTENDTDAPVDAETGKEK